MTIYHTAIVIITLTVLQACSSYNTKPAPPVSADSKNISATRPKAVITKLTIPEAQIIHELYQSGCLIEQVEINRSKQQMHISCANDRPVGPNALTSAPL